VKMTNRRHFWITSGLRAGGVPSWTAGTNKRTGWPRRGTCRGCRAQY
jgi:hypothetical protein